MTKIKFNVFNIKLQSDLEGELRIKAYQDLFIKLTGKKVFTRVNKTEAVTIYPAYVREQNGTVYYYGAMGKGISFFDKAEISFSIDNEFSTEPTERNKLIEPITTDYIFIPSIHRFALIRKGEGISISDCKKFLDEQLNKIITKDEKINVDFERDELVVDEIINAKAVYSIEYSISYSNNDALKSQGALFDKLLHKNNIGKLNVSASSDHNESGMDIKEVDFLGGGLEVAKKNGIIKSAHIKPQNSNKKIYLRNINTPKTETVDIEDSDNFFLKIFNKLISLYSNGS